MQRSSALNRPGVVPKYACPCLNVKIFPSLINKPQLDGQPPSAPASTPGWEAFLVDASSIQTAYDQLALKSRSPEHGSHVVCHLCNIIVYRVVESGIGAESSSSSSSNVTSPVGISASLMSPTTRERPDFQKLFQQDKNAQTWILVHTRDGCISGRQLEDSLSRASPIFGLNIPVIETMSPAPTPPSNTVPLPSPSVAQGASGNPNTGSNIALTSYQLNLNWPEFIPPPPFVPSHPLYAHLARIAKKASSSARADAEAAIQTFIHAKRREVAEYEAELRRQVNTVWRVWRDSTDKDRASSSHVDSGMVDPRSNTKRHASNTSTSSTTSSSGVAGISAHRTMVIRAFQEDPNVSPRASDPQFSHSSSFSPSTATPRVHPRMSALGTSLIQSGMHMPRARASSPISPSTREAGSLSSGVLDNAATLADKHTAPSFSLTPPGNKENGIRIRKPKESVNKHRSTEGQRNASPDNISSTGATALVAEGNSAIADDISEGSSRANGITKKKAVTFSSREPDVVTVARDINSEKLQKISEEHAKGEEAMFDLDIEGDEPAQRKTSDRKGNLESTAVKDAKKEMSTRRVTGFNVRHEEEDVPDVTLSFKNRPSQYTMARSLPKTQEGIFASTSLGADPSRHNTQDNPTLSSSPLGEAPYGGELLKLVAGQTPSHRNAWPGNPNEGSDDDGEDFHDAEQEEDTGADIEPMEIEGGDTKGSNGVDTQILSKSVPMDIPSMRSLVQSSTAADNDFENAMSKSHDPGPALELLAGNGRDEDDEDEDDYSQQASVPLDTSKGKNSVRAEDGDVDAADEEQAELMKRLMEGRGSLHAQKILSQTERGVPASMWRSMA